MGITKQFKEYEEILFKKLKISYKNLTLCELGDQFYGSISAKLIYESLGVFHTSIDLNGRGGSLPLDLCEPVPIELENKFDVITNYGTSEHVNDQFNVFYNIHKMCKINGIMIHGLPCIGNWKNHCRYYYSQKVFNNLAKINNYDILELTTLTTEKYQFPKNLIVAVLRKTNNFFIDNKKFNEIEIYDSGNLEHTQNYTK